MLVVLVVVEVVDEELVVVVLVDERVLVVLLVVLVAVDEELYVVVLVDEKVLLLPFPPLLHPSGATSTSYTSTTSFFGTALTMATKKQIKGGGTATGTMIPIQGGEPVCRIEANNTWRKR